ncbi:MAG: alpha/beta fold hydrolase [Mycoplasmatales bacterium]
MRKKFLNILKYLSFTIIGVLILAFIYLQTGHYEATPTALSLSSKADETADYLTFNNNSTTGFIFYPGAKVDVKAYSYLQNIKDTNVYIAKFPFEIAFFNLNVAQTIIEEHPEIDKWYIGGHSLGGVGANYFAQNNPNLISGVATLASYPTEKITNSKQTFLALFATNDGLVTDYKEKEQLLPASSTQTKIVEINGGNHAQFGDYGIQKNDQIATIDKEKQHEIILKELSDFCRK